MNSISKNVYTDKWDDIVNKYSNKYQSTIKMNPVDVKSSTYSDCSKKIIIKILNTKLVILLEYQNLKIYLQKATLQIGLKRFLWSKKLKIMCRGHVLLVILTEKKLLERFTKTNCKSNQEEFRIEKVIKRKGDRLYVKWKGYNNSFNSWIDIANVEVELDLSNYTAKQI